MRLRLASVVAALLASFTLSASPASAAPFFSLVGGTPYTLGSLKGWEDATLKLSAPGIVTFTYLGQTSDDKVIFSFVPGGAPWTTYHDPRFASSICGGIGCSDRFYDFLLDINNALVFDFSQPDVWPYDTYANDFGPERGSNAAVFLDSTSGERQRNHLTSVILDFDDGSHGVGDDGRTFGDMRWMISVDQVPEPGSLVMLLTALGALLWLRRRTVRGPAAALGLASGAILATGISITAMPASATVMLISFESTGANDNIYGLGPTLPISGEVTFDTALGMVASVTAGSTYTGPMSAVVLFGGQTYAFSGDGHVTATDDFPVQMTSSTDVSDFFDVAMSAYQPTGATSDHVDRLHFIVERKRCLGPTWRA